ncbi:MAG TPA: acyl-CoA dehydrogenase [Stellaceae bacterium]|jgi:alkylation response protein AidB-like acyl-CoA dehydrogenase|nr:acyl-CoA dehydrogenase [Stellaceae bacterium]
MSEYVAPLAEMRFALAEIAKLGEIAALPGCEAASPDVVDAVLEQAGKFAGAVLSPLNRVGDIEHSRLENGVVRTPTGFKEAYRGFIDGGWAGISAAPEHGGQGLPLVLATAIFEMWNSANLAFSLCPMLAIVAIELLAAQGTNEQKRLYLGRLVSGEWTGTMNLTEPQAGSDLGALRTRAVRENGHYRITGQKIFITWGEHDCAENIVHLVLARLPDSPAGSKGISLFLVPKFLVNDDGSLGARNDLRVVSLEHKLGIHASPTCVMAYGDNGGAVGYLVGAENRGLEGMFIMMNNARLHVGLEGVALAERAYQQARHYARERVQGRPVGAAEGERLPILHHPDVRRMLLTMRASTEAARALTYYAAGAADRARHEPDPAKRETAQARLDLLTPVVKAWCTDIGVEIASTGIQVHGGMGFIEETGAAQYLRDARITPIYEGTNGIQAADLVGRKLARDQGKALRALLADMRDCATRLSAMKDADFSAIRTRLFQGIDAADQAGRALIDAYAKDPGQALAGSKPFLNLLGTVTAGWLLAEGALAASRRLKAREGDGDFLKAKIATTRFFAEHNLAPAPGLLPAVTGGVTVMGFDLDVL